MNRFWTACAFGSLIALSSLTATVAHGATPAEEEAAAQRRDERRAQADGATKATPAERKAAKQAELDRKLAEARTQRDQELQQAADTDADKARLERRKQEISQKYATLAAALRDQYVESEAAAATADEPAAAPAKSATAKAAPAGTDWGKKIEDTRKQITAIDQKLSSDTAKHDAKLADLNEKLQQASSGGKQKQIDKARAAVDKENAAFDAKKSDYESQRAALRQQLVEMGAN